MAGRLAFAISFFLMHGTAHAGPVDVTFSSKPDKEVVKTIRDTLPDNIKPETALQARRQGRRAKVIVQDTLNSYGYFNPVISVRVEGGALTPRTVLDIDTGPLFRMGKVELKFAAPKPRDEDIAVLKEQLPLKKGVPAVPLAIIDAERAIGVSLRRMGYAFSDVGDRDVIGDKDAATISVRYNIDSKKRVAFGKVIFPETVITKDKYFTRLDTTKPGDIYDPAKIALYNARLSESRLYSSSSVQLTEEPVGVSPAGDAVHDIILTVKERPRNTIALGTSYGTDEGFGVNAVLTRRNLTRRGDLLIADTRLAQREKGLNLTWRLPNELGYSKGLVFTAAALDENTDAFDQQVLKLGAGYEVVKSQRLNYSFGVRGQYIRQTESDVTEYFQTLATYAGFNLDYSDSLLDPKRGWRAEGQVVPTYAFGGTSDKPYVKAVSQGRVYLPLDSKARVVLAGRLRAGVLVGTQADELPADDRFYAGGGGSVRGYGYQAIGPFDTDDVPTGGRSLLDSSIEGRWRYNDRIGVVAFFDAGNVSDALYPRFDNLNVGAGVGVRYMTPAGPLRVDIATPLNPSSRDEAFQVYISIGQAF